MGGNPRRSRVRYFAPISEVQFCGHATIALAVALTTRDGAGTFTFETAVGPVVVETRREGCDTIASFTSVEPQVAQLEEDDLTNLLGLLGMESNNIDTAYPPKLAFAGNWHPVLVVASRRVFDSFSFDPAALRQLMDARHWTTVTILHQRAEGEFDARNLFPAHGITEDPATGSAAAAVGGYVRAARLVDPPSRILIHQGHNLGRPGLLTADIPPSGGIVISGKAAAIPPALQ